MQSRSKKWRRSKSGSGESLTSVEASSPVRETKDLPQLQSQTSPRASTHEEPLTPSAEIASQYTAHHQPTTAHLPDEKLPSVWNVTEWSKLLWYKYEATFAISMLETWESVLLHSILIFLIWLIYWAGRTYLPDHIRVISGRVSYYFLGPEGASTH